MNRVAETLSNLFSDFLPNTNDVTRRSHLNDLAIVRHTVKSGVNQQSAFAEHCLDVERHLHVGGVHIFVLQDYRIEFQYAIVFGIHSCKYTKIPQPKQQQHRAKLAFINRLSAHLAEAVNLGFARVPVADERLLILVYWPDASMSCLYSGPLRKDCSRFFITLPEEPCLAQATMHVYVWFQAPYYHRATDGHDRVFIEHASPSRYLGKFG